MRREGRGAAASTVTPLLPECLLPRWEGPKGGGLVISMWSILSSMDPALTWGTGGNFLSSKR